MSLDLIATSTMGLESVVARELADLGYESRIVQLGRVAFRGDESAICRANLWLRSAGRVLLELGRFPATDFGQLFDATFALPWERWIPADGAFPVKGRSLKSQLSSVPACQKIVKKAVAEKLMQAHGAGQLAETGATFPLEVSILKDEATLTIDTSGSGLHRRGYRPLTGRAPLRETLASGLVLLSFWKPERPLIDPFCGTGTIPIEAVMIARNMAVGLQRRFAAEDWPTLPTSFWQQAREEARDLARDSLPEKIIGNDIDETALSQARHHAKLAGVNDDIQFQQRDFYDLTSKRKYGCLIANPPYAQRVGSADEVDRLYRAMPEVLRRLKTWSHFIFTAYPDFEKLIGQEASRRRKLYNSRIECTYYQFHGPRLPVEGKPVDTSTEDTTEATFSSDAPSSPARKSTKRPQHVQAFGGLTEKGREQAEIFRSRLTKRAKHLRRWPGRGITCYRLYERDVPEVPLIVDRYEDCLHIAEYDRPHDRTPAEHADWLDLMVRTAGEVMDVPPKNIFLKRRSRQRGTSQYDRHAQDRHTRIVQEDGLKFRVNLSDYIDTGLFLDHRITRSMVRKEAAGMRFLNLFGYTGAFTVYAAAGGAAETTTVDLSNTYLDWAQENLQLNNLAGPQHQFVRSDATGFLDALPQEPLFDLAVVDPPTFSNSKMTEDVWDVQRDHVDLLNRLLLRMTTGGVIYFSTNFRRFKFHDTELTGVKIHEITRQTIPDDFRNRRIHRCWRLEIEDSR